MTFDPAAMITEARSHVGFHEGPNNENPFSRWQYGDTFEPWCDSFVSYCAYQAGYRFPDYYTFGEKGDNNVGFTHQHAIRQGTWREPSTIARPCWLVVLSFDVPDQHIEIVLADGGGSSLQTVGGNTGDAVAYRTRNRSNVVGFVALDVNVPVPIPGPPPAPKEDDMIDIDSNTQPEPNRFRGATIDLNARTVQAQRNAAVNPNPNVDPGPKKMWRSASKVKDDVDGVARFRIVTGDNNTYTFRVD